MVEFILDDVVIGSTHSTIMLKRLGKQLFQTPAFPSWPIHDPFNTFMLQTDEKISRVSVQRNNHLLCLHREAGIIESIFQMASEKFKNTWCVAQLFLCVHVHSSAHMCANTHKCA